MYVYDRHFDLPSAMAYAPSRKIMSKPERSSSRESNPLEPNLLFTKSSPPLGWGKKNDCAWDVLFRMRGKVHFQLSRSASHCPLYRLLFHLRLHSFEFEVNFLPRERLSVRPERLSRHRLDGTLFCSLSNPAPPLGETRKIRT